VTTVYGVAVVTDFCFWETGWASACLAWAPRTSGSLRCSDRRAAPG